VALKFKVFDLPIAIGVDFLLMAVVLGVLWRPVEELPAWVAVLTGSVLVHELGHAALFDYFGVKPSIRLYSGGGMTMGIRLPTRQSIVVSAAGPGMGLIIGGIAALAAISSPRLWANPIMQDVIWANLGLSLLNLLPFRGTDGGSILNELTELLLGRPAATTGRVVALVVLAATCLGLIRMGQYDLAVIVVWFAISTTIGLGGLTGLSAGKKNQVPGQLLVDGLYEEGFKAACVEMAKKPAEIGPILDGADALRLMTRYADSITGYIEAIKMDPDEPRALRGRASALRSLGLTGAADDVLGALLSLPIGKAANAQVIGLGEAGRYKEARDLAVRAIPQAANPAMARVLHVLASAYNRTLGRDDEALRVTDELIAGEPGEATFHEQRALILCDLGRFQEARSSARRALAGRPKHPELMETAGIVERMAGNPEAARSLLVDAAVARPNNPIGRAELAVCQVQLGRLHEARTALATLPPFAGPNPFVLYAKAALASAEGADDTALGLLAEAGRARPHLGLRAGVDPVFGKLLADPARRAWLAGVPA
jgi:tetratricopeptide (TPR) repeat protein